MAFDPNTAVHPELLEPAPAFDPETAVPPEEYVRKPAATLTEAMARTPYGKFSAGFVKGLSTPVKAGVNLGAKALQNVGLLSEEQLQALSEREQEFERQYEENLQPSGLGEFVGTMAIPVPGGKMNAASKLAKTAARVGQGAVFGGMTEAANADVASKEYAGRVAGGSVLGGITAPIAAFGFEKTLKGLASLANKGYQFAGKTAPEILDALAMTRRKLSAVTGATEGNLEKTAAALRKQPVHDVPGYKETAASQVARMRQAILPASEQKLVGKEATEYGRRKLVNIEALRNALGHVAKSPAARAKAVNAREEATRPMFKEFEKTIFDSDPDLEWFLNTPAGRQAAARADRYVRNLGYKTGRIRVQPGPQELIVEGAAPEKYRYSGVWLDGVRESLKSMVSEGAQKGMKGKERRALIQLKDLYTRHLEDLAPDTFGAAMQRYRELSRPINQMDVGRKLQEALSATETGASARSFTKALSDVPTLLQRSTGTSRFNRLNEVLDPEQMALVYGVQDKLKKEEILRTFKAFGREAESPVDPKASPWINLLHPLVTATHSIKKITDDAVSNKVAKELAVELLYPEKFADVVDQAIRATKAQGALSKTAGRVGGASAASYLNWQADKEEEAKTLNQLNEKYQ